MKNDSNYDGNCTACHCLSGTYEISWRWIFVRLSVQVTLCVLNVELCDFDIVQVTVGVLNVELCNYDMYRLQLVC